MLSNSQQPTSREDQVYQERIRQAKWAFNLYVTFVGISAIITLIGFVLLLFGYISQGTCTAIAGLASTAVGNRCLQLSRDTSDRLNLNTSYKLQQSK